MRPALIVVALLSLVLGLAACGDEQNPASTDHPSAQAPLYRESIEAAREARVGKVKLAARDKPLSVGETAPPFDAFAQGKTNLVVFYRGHW